MFNIDMKSLVHYSNMYELLKQTDQEELTWP